MSLGVSQPGGTTADTSVADQLVFNVTFHFGFATKLFLLITLALTIKNQIC